MDDKMIRRIITAEIKEVRDRVLEFIGSDETQDRVDEVIRAEGWMLKNFKKHHYVISRRKDLRGIGIIYLKCICITFVNLFCHSYGYRTEIDPPISMNPIVEKQIGKLTRPTANFYYLWISNPSYHF